MKNVNSFPVNEKPCLWYFNFADIDDVFPTEKSLLELFMVNGSVAMLDYSLKSIPLDSRISKIREVQTSLYSEATIVESELRIFTCTSLFCKLCDNGVYEASLLFPTKEVPSYLLRASSWNLSSYGNARLWRCTVTCSGEQLLRYLHDACVEGGWMYPFIKKLFDSKKGGHVSSGTTLSNKSKAFKVVGKYSEMKHQLDEEKTPLNQWDKIEIDDAINELELCANPKYDKQIGMLRYLLRKSERLETSEKADF